LAVSAAIIGLGPLAVHLALRLPPINQVDYADAWFYSAYAWVPRHHFSVFEWNYFSVRFPAILSIGLFERVFGVYGGYIVLRYLLAVGSGAAVYLAVRRFSTVSVAAGATALLYLNPFFSRMLLWDYASFVVVSAGTAGLALWWWTDGRTLAWTLIPGGALAIAVFANVIFATALLILVAVEGAAALRRGSRAVLRLCLRLGVAGASAVLVFLVGFLGYERFTSLTPDDLVRPTIDFLRSNEQNSALYQHPVGDWLGDELRIWAPVIVSVALVAALRGRLFDTDLRARVAQLCIGYTAFLWLYRFLVTSSVLETWWAYSVVVVVVAPALGVLIDEVSRDQRAGIWALVGVCALTALAIRTFDGSAVDLYGAISDRPRLLWTIVAAAVGGTLLLAARSRARRTAALVAVVVSSTAMAWAPSVFDGRGETGVFVSNGDLDWDAYGGAKQFVELVRDYDARGHRVYTWYPDTQGITNVGWTMLPQLGSTVQVLGAPTRLNKLEPLGKARLLQPDVAYVLAMSSRRNDLTAARTALRSAGFQERMVQSGVLADGRLRYVLIELTGKPSA
jgi:hypothetical protein